MLLTAVSLAFIVLSLVAIAMSVRALKSSSGTTELRAASPSSVDIQHDTADYKLKYKDSAAVVQSVVTEVLAQTLTNKTLASPVVSGAGYRQVAVINLDGATWHTGNGTADYLSWTAPADCVIERVLINTTTKSTGAATVDAGSTAVNNHTNGDNILDAADIGAAALCYSNLGAADTEKREVFIASGTWLTFHALADPTGLVGKAYIFYFTL